MQCRAIAQIDPMPLATLYADLGLDAAEDTVCRVLEDIASRLNALDAMQARCAFAEIPPVARRINAVATQIGLIEVAKAADHVSKAAGQGDGVALDATLGRLDRGFDAALGQIWDIQQGS